MVRAAPRLDAPRAREAGAAILQDDARARRDDARTEAAEEALDERHGRALGVDRAQVDRAAARLRRARLLVAPAARQVLGLQQMGDIGAVPDTAGRIVQRELHAAHLVDERRLQRVEQSERLERGDALCRGRQLGDLEGPVARRSGSTQRGS